MSLLSLFDDIIMKIMCFLGIDVFDFATNEIQQEILYFCVSRFLINSQQEKFIKSIINVNFHTFKICQEIANSQLSTSSVSVFFFVIRCYKVILFTLLIRSRCFENVSIQFRGDSERYRSENVQKKIDKFRFII